MVDKLLEIPNVSDYFGSSGEDTAMSVEFKSAINTYLKKFVVSHVRTLEDLIKFNYKFSDLVGTETLSVYTFHLLFKFSKTNKHNDIFSAVFAS